MKRARPLCLLALLSLSASCAPTKREAAPVVHYASTQVSSDCIIGSDTSRVVLDWPRFEGGAPGVADSLSEATRAFVLAGWGGGSAFSHEDSLTRAFFDELVLVQERTGLRQPWHLNRRVEVLGDTLGTLSLSFVESSYLGGAHPNTQSRRQVRDRNDGRRLTYADLFRADSRDSLSAVCEPYFRTARELTHDVSLDGLGFWFASGRFLVNDNFALTSAGLRFRFDAYEIAPYAMGPTDFVVPYAAVRSFARADGPLKREGR